MNRSGYLGANYGGDSRCQFCVWAPHAQRVDIDLVSPSGRYVTMRPGPRGYHQALLEDIAPGTLYKYRLDQRAALPDPASRYQPQGVHGASQVVDPRFAWHDKEWRGLPLQEYIIYELHVGTSSAEGTFDGLIPHLPRLKDLGITAIELMPVAQFPGDRNWGYDGVYPFAVQNSYGGPEGLKRLVDASHGVGLGVVLDVVYNHLGPEGNYLGGFGPYFTDCYKTPWGPAINFDGPESDEVRRFFVENALYWVRDYHIDALRLDAVHAILDRSPRPFLQELSLAVHEEADRLQRRVYLIPESAANDARLIRAPEAGGYGLDAQWNDDFHHALHALITGEQTGYYQDYGRLHHLAKALREGFVYTGEYSAYRRHRHGTSSRDIPAGRFVIFAQNHDQVGNRMLGERLRQLVPLERLKLAAGIVLLSPFIPLLFMGEEYAETAPFQYFVSHSDAKLVEAVRRGRRDEFASFQWSAEPPDPQSEETYRQCKLDHSLSHRGHHRVLRDFYKELIELRKNTPALAQLSKETMEVLTLEQHNLLVARRWSGEDEVIIVAHFADGRVPVQLPVPIGRWFKRLDSAEERWGGRGSELPQRLDSQGRVALSVSAHALALYIRQEA